MKRLALTAIAASTMATGALAADVIEVIPIVTPVPVVVEPEPSRAYVTLLGGFVFARDTVWNQPEAENIIDFRGYRIGGAIGFNLNSTLALEGDVTWARVYPTEVCDGEEPDLCEVVPDDIETNATLLTLMGNLRVGATMGTFQPYVAVGAGAARLRIDSPAGEFGIDGIGPGGGRNHDWTWGFQAIAGVDFALTDTISLGVRYRFQHIGPTDFIDLGDDPFTVNPFNVHSIEGGITIRFGG
ncbi:MAG: outer membrane protein [Bauldia sp.]